MKYIISLLVSLLSLTAFAQDMLYLHSGEQIKCKVQDITETQVKYVYPGETIVNVVSKYGVEKIQFENGRVQQITDKIVITSDKDWEKVIILDQTEEVTGLKRVSELTKNSSSTWSLSFTENQGHYEAKAEKKIKIAAAKQGCPFILVTNKSGKSGGVLTDAHASMTGILYRY